MSIELVIAALMAVVAILVGFASPAPNGEAIASRDVGVQRQGSETSAPES